MVREQQRVGAVIQQHRADLERVVAQNGVVQRRLPPASAPIRIHAPLEQPLDAFIVVPVRLAEQHRAQALGVQLAALHEDLERGIVAGLGCVIGNLLVIRIRAPLEQQARQIGMVRDPGGAVQRALPLGARQVVHLVPTGVGTRAAIEQNGRRPDEPLRARAIEPEVLRKAQVRERIPAVRTALRGGVGAIEREEPLHGGRIAENRGHVDIAARDLGVRCEDRLGALQCSVPDCGLEEGRPRIRRVVHQRNTASASRPSDSICRSTMPW